MQVLKTYGTDNTTRKGNEAVRIATKGGELLNSKAEYRQTMEEEPCPELTLNYQRVHFLNYPRSSVTRFGASGGGDSSQ